MSNSDQSQALLDGHAEAHLEEPSVPGTEEVRHLLAVIARQITEADRRHVEMLDEMKVRLEQLGSEARSARPRVPGEFAPAFARVEDALASLGERISEARSERQVRVEHAATTEMSEAAVTESNGQADERPADATAATPMALRSAFEGAGNVPPIARHGEFGRHPAMPSDVDPFDMVDTDIPHSGSDEWTPAQAEALTRINERTANGGDDDAAVMPAKAADPAPHAPEAAADPAAQSPHLAFTTGAELQRSIDAERDWLEERFADIASRLEQSFSELRSQPSIDALSERFEQLEERVGAALQDVATRSDLEGLRFVEAHIEELTRQLDDAQLQFARLEQIEANLNAVAEHLASQPSLADMAPVAGPSREEIEQIAAKVADDVAERFSALTVTDRGSSEDAPGVRAMLEAFMVEQRNGGEQTVSMLDTMQQALIRVLDRVDAIEAVQSKTAAKLAESAQRNAPPQSQPAPTGWVGETMAPAVEPPHVEPAAPPAPVERTGIDKLRQDFIADAQRAKAKAAAEAAEAPKGQSKRPAAQPAPTATSTEKASDKKAATTDQPAAGSGKIFGMSPRLLLAALAAVVAINGALLMFKGKDAPRPTEPAAVSAPATPAGQPAAPAATDTTAPATDGEVEGADPATKPQSQLEGSDSGPATATNAPVSGDAGFETGDGEATESSPQASLSGPGLPGLRLRESTTQPSAADIALITHQQNLAQASGQVGAATAAIYSTASYPGSALPGVSTGSITTDQSGQMARSSALDLPPATVGPLSLRLAAANGDPSAEFQAGARLAEGKGTTQDFKEALRWYQRSASRGFAQSQYRLGTLYERGLGTKIDLGHARAWYLRAAEQGNVKSMHNLAVLAAGRANGSPDYTTASQWFSKAAAYGLADSQFNLGVLYENGLGVERSEQQAYKWYSLAARGGDNEAGRKRDLMKSRLKPDEVSTVDVEISAFQPERADPLINDPIVAGEDWKSRENSARNG